MAVWKSLSPTGIHFGSRRGRIPGSSGRHVAGVVAGCSGDDEPATSSLAWRHPYWNCLCHESWECWHWSGRRLPNGTSSAKVVTYLPP